MSTEEIIEQMNRTKQEINDGSRAVRKQIDEKVLPIIPSSQQRAADKIHEARRIFTTGDQEAKKAIEEAKHYILSPIDVLPEELTYGVTKEWIAPFFIPVLFFCRPIKRVDFDDFANRIAEGQSGNVIRGFPFGQYEPHWVKRDWVIYPYLKNANGKFMLTRYNSAYWDELYFRVDAFTKRNITVFIDLIDNCALHKRDAGWWNDHPWNGKNNVNGTSTWNNMVYHFMEDMHASKPGATETGELTFQFYYDLVDRLYSRFAGKIGFTGGNEVPARLAWHHRIKDVIQRGSVNNFPRDFTMTSMIHVNFYKVNIWHNFIYGLHGCCDLDTYAERDKIIPDKEWNGIKSKKYIASMDGCFPPKTLKLCEDFVYKILKDGRAGFEGNLRPIFVKVDGKWTSVARQPDKIDWSLRTMDFAYAEATKKGWMRFRNESS